MRGTTWWVCGESVVGNDSQLVRQKPANFFAYFLIFLQRRQDGYHYCSSYHHESW
jgi:hypothetical protein